MKRVLVDGTPWFDEKCRFTTVFGAFLRLVFRRHEPDHYILGILFFVSTSEWSSAFLVAFPVCCRSRHAHHGVFLRVHERSGVHHHTTFLVVAFIGRCTPQGALFRSIESYDTTGRTAWAELAWRSGDIWALRLVGLQLSAIYFWGAIDKCRVAYLVEIESNSHSCICILFDYPGEWFHVIAVIMAVSTVSRVLPDLRALVRRVMLPLMVLGVLFHVEFTICYP